MKHYFFIIIFVLALFLRVYLIGSVPPSPSLDEVSIGYNAYSILNTGKDEYGSSFPLLLRAYDDFRPAFYVYLVIPFVALFGLSVEAVRLPSVLLSLLSVVTVFFLVRELFPKDPIVFKMPISRYAVARISMLLVAISPWHIYLSRLGHEVNLGFTVTILGIYFFLRAMNAKTKTVPLVISAVFFALSLYSYQSQKVIIPGLVIGLICIYFMTFKKFIRSFVIAGIIGLLVSLPAVFVSLSDEGLTRFEGTSVFTKEHPLHGEHLQKVTSAKEEGDIIGQIVYNRRLTNVFIFSEQYLAHFNPYWLFLGGEKEDHKVPNLGLMYGYELPLIFLGGFLLFRSTVSKQSKLLLLLWVLISPLAASITTGAPHAMRSFTVIPSLQIISSFGLVYLSRVLSQKVRSVVLLSGFVVLIGGSVLYLYTNYFVEFPKIHSGSFQYSLSSALTDDVLSGHTGPVVISNKDLLTQSYMFYLFHTEYDPKQYQREGGTELGGFAETHTIGRVSFRPIEYDSEQEGTLLIGNVSEIPPGADIKAEYRLLDGTESTVVVEK